MKFSTFLGIKINKKKSRMALLFVFLFLVPLYLFSKRLGNLFIFFCDNRQKSPRTSCVHFFPVFLESCLIIFHFNLFQKKIIENMNFHLDGKNKPLVGLGVHQLENGTFISYLHNLTEKD